MAEQVELPKYKMLQAEMVKGKDRELAAAVSSFILSGQDAHKLAGHEGFSYQVLDHTGRCGVVMYKGIEVALLFKRQVVERQPWPSEPIPVSTLNEPKDAWLQIDLLDSTLVEKQKGLSERLQKSMEQIERLRIVWQAADADRKRLQEELQRYESERQELRTLRTRVALMEQERRGT
jgi:hypothetical protein